MTRRIKLRTLLIGGLTTLFFVVLITRIFWIQIVSADFWQDHAKTQWSKELDLPASRGTITDRNGDVLAEDIPAYTVAINPRIITKYGIQQEVVEGLHKLLGKPEGELLKLINAKTKDGKLYGQREVRNEGWKIDLDLKDKVEAFAEQLRKEKKIPDSGIILIQEEKRYYPKESLAAHILGYTDRGGNAVTGLEKEYDEDLKGHDGILQYEADPKGVHVPKASEVYQPAKDGKNIQLTIDDTIQQYIENAMKEAYAKLNPISMTVIAADPNTMEILGLANMPTFNPNTYYDNVKQENFFNHAVRSQYEPGSTFKIVTLAGAVQEGVFNPDENYMSGSIHVPGGTLHDINRYGWGPISFLEGVKRSSNVAFVQLGYKKLGEEKFEHYVKDFGFGQKTGIELPGELPGQVSMHYPIEYATATYGHGQLLVTPIQQVAAVAAVANGGKLMVPHIIKSITDPTTGKTESTEPKVVRQVISPDKAREVGSYLEQVVADQKIGTGRHAYIEGYRVAGKTGTAVKPINGKYDYTKQVVSFIGYAPVDDPKILVLVVIDQPQNSKLGGGTAAAPIFKQIVSQVLPYMGVAKETTDADSKKDKKSQTLIKTPPMTGLSLKEASSRLRNQGLAYETLGKGDKVVSQYPKEGSDMTVGQQIYLLTEEGKKMQVPDLTGQSLRDAVEILNLMQVKVTASGEGYVISQKATQNKDGTRTVALTLEPPKTEAELKAEAEQAKAEADKAKENTEQKSEDSKNDSQGVDSKESSETSTPAG
ncbi:stage V sporulation protein D [Paenibacillus sp. CAA11]|uniref:penicillin-binding transpeptidase domain-containing protein n=1 Tax=Paenibacillus sp. CAA11 TaxID=1532905 RepID=UPI000D380E5C|nr:penicillin-binding transpeptidase domain-containing protein [Paenibacillus sp. CAA11]AWB45370.1 stage V sporulation protein D [Paenibacillus sp. CAA11]